MTARARLRRTARSLRRSIEAVIRLSAVAGGPGVADAKRDVRYRYRSVA